MRSSACNQRIALAPRTGNTGIYLDRAACPVNVRHRFGGPQLANAPLSRHSYALQPSRRSRLLRVVQIIDLRKWMMIAHGSRYRLGCNAGVDLCGLNTRVSQ